MIVNAKNFADKIIGYKKYNWCSYAVTKYGLNIE